MQPAYDSIIIGGGHNGLTCAAYLAMGGEKQGRNKLKVLVLERYHKVGGAAMSEEIYPGFTYSTCSYVCSLLRPEIMRELDLPGHGLQVIPYEGSLNVLTNGPSISPPTTTTTGRCGSCGATPSATPTPMNATRSRSSASVASSSRCC